MATKALRKAFLRKKKMEHETAQIKWVKKEVSVQKELSFKNS